MRPCPDHGKRGMGNIILNNRYGRDTGDCSNAGPVILSSPTKAQYLLFRASHTEESKIKEVIMYLLDGKSFREAAVPHGIDKDTVIRIWKRFVAYCEESMDGLLKDSISDLRTLSPSPVQERGYNRESPCGSPISGLPKGSGTFWKTLCGDKRLLPRRGCAANMSKWDTFRDLLSIQREGEQAL